MKCRRGVLRELLIDGEVFEVLFDGVHDDKDRDLFHEADRIIMKIDGHKPALIHCTALVSAALVGQRPLTMREIAAAAHTTLQVVNTALYNLRLQDRLGSSITVVEDAPAHLGPLLKKYWLKDAEAK